MCEDKWVVDGEKTEPHWLEVWDEEQGYRVVVKWDGCMHFEAINQLTGETNCIHICELDDFIAVLESLRAKAREFFGEKWR